MAKHPSRLKRRLQAESLPHMRGPFDAPFASVEQVLE